jgi:hypothetical protein
MPAVVLEPPRKLNPSGELRRVGVEIEFIALELEEAARVVKSCFGGDIDATNPYELVVRNTRLGDFDVAIDADFLKNRALQKTFGRRIERLVGAVTGVLAPREIACPPITFDRLMELEDLTTALVDSGALGTDAARLEALTRQYRHARAGGKEHAFRRALDRLDPPEEAQP